MFYNATAVPAEALRTRGAHPLGLICRRASYQGIAGGYKPARLPGSLQRSAFRAPRFCLANHQCLSTRLETRSMEAKYISSECLYQKHPRSESEEHASV